MSIPKMETTDQRKMRCRNAFAATFARVDAAGVLQFDEAAYMRAMGAWDCAYGFPPCVRLTDDAAYMEGYNNEANWGGGPGSGAGNKNPQR